MTSLTVAFDAHQVVESGRKRKGELFETPSNDIAGNKSLRIIK